MLPPMTTAPPRWRLRVVSMRMPLLSTNWPQYTPARSCRSGRPAFFPPESDVSAALACADRLRTTASRHGRFRRPTGMHKRHLRPIVLHAECDMTQGVCSVMARQTASPTETTCRIRPFSIKCYPPLPVPSTTLGRRQGARNGPVGEPPAAGRPWRRSADDARRPLRARPRPGPDFLHSRLVHGRGIPWRSCAL